VHNDLLATFIVYVRDDTVKVCEQVCFDVQILFVEQSTEHRMKILFVALAVFLVSGMPCSAQDESSPRRCYVDHLGPGVLMFLIGSWKADDGTSKEIWRGDNSQGICRVREIPASGVSITEFVGMKYALSINTTELSMCPSTALSEHGQYLFDKFTVLRFVPNMVSAEDLFEAGKPVATDLRTGNPEHKQELIREGSIVRFSDCSCFSLLANIVDRD